MDFKQKMKINYYNMHPLVTIINKYSIFRFIE